MYIFIWTTVVNLHWSWINFHCWDGYLKYFPLMSRLESWRDDPNPTSYSFFVFVHLFWLIKLPGWKWKQFLPSAWWRICGNATLKPTAGQPACSKCSMYVVLCGSDTDSDKGWSKALFQTAEMDCCCLLGFSQLPTSVVKRRL